MHQLKTVLLVDDHEPTLRAWVRAFKRKSPQRIVLQATNGETALALAKATSIEVAIVDQRLGIERGAEVARRLKTMCASLHVILTSCDVTIADVLDAQALGADIVGKVPDWTDVVETIERRGDLNAFQTHPTFDSRHDLEAVTKDHVLFVMALHGNNISKAAASLGISRTGLQKMLAKWGVRRTTSPTPLTRRRKS